MKLLKSMGSHGETNFKAIANYFMSKKTVEEVKLDFMLYGISYKMSDALTGIHFPRNKCNIYFQEYEKVHTQTWGSSLQIQSVRMEISTTTQLEVPVCTKLFRILLTLLNKSASIPENFQKRNVPLLTIPILSCLLLLEYSQEIVGQAYPSHILYASVLFICSITHSSISRYDHDDHSCQQSQIYATVIRK